MSFKQISDSQPHDQDKNEVRKLNNVQLNKMLFNSNESSDDEEESEPYSIKLTSLQKQEQQQNNLAISIQSPTVEYNSSQTVNKDINSPSRKSRSDLPHIPETDFKKVRKQSLDLKFLSVSDTPDFPNLNPNIQHLNKSDHNSQQSHHYSNSLSVQASNNTKVSNPRRSSIKQNSKFVIPEKEFALEQPKTESESSNSQSNSSITESSNEDIQEEEEEDLENSQICSLKKKLSRRHYEGEEDSIIEDEAQSYILNIKESMEQILKMIRAESFSNSSNKNNSPSQQTQKRKTFALPQLSFEVIDLHNIIFLFSYLIKKEDHIKLNAFRGHISSKIKEPQLSIINKFRPYEYASDPQQGDLEDFKKLISNEISVKGLQQIANDFFISKKQAIFESSIQFGYFEEFIFVFNTFGKAYEFVLKSKIFERSLEWQNEKYIQLFLEKQYLIDIDLHSENYEFVIDCQFDSNHSNLTDKDVKQKKSIPSKLIMNQFVMIYFYSIEHLSPQMMRYIVNQEESIPTLKAILKHFVLYHLNTLAKLVMQKILSKKHEFEKEVITVCLQSCNFEFLYNYYEFTRLKISGWLEDADNQRDMVRSLSRSTGINFEALLFFMRKIKLWSQKELILLMAKTLYERLDASNNDTNFLFSFSNPLKIIVLINEIMQITIKNEFFHKNLCDKTSKQYSQFAQKLVKTAIDEEQMYELLVDWDLEGRKLLYIIYENSMSDLIANDKVQDVIEILWNGNTNTSFSIMNFTSVSQNLFNSSLHKAALDGESLEYSLDKSYQSEDFIGRKSVWLNQIQFRNLIDQSLIILFSILFLTYLLDSFSVFTRGFMPVNEDSEVVEQTIADFQANFSYWIIVPLFVGVNIPLNAVVNLTYLQVFEKFATFNSTQVFDLLFALIADLYILFVYSMHLYSYESVQLFLVIFFDILSIFCYLRIILCLTSTKAFGIIIQALGVIFIEVAKFFNTFIAILLLFAFIGFILFNQLSSGQFQTFVEGLLFLIEAMFAQFQFSDFSDQYPITGVIFMLCFLYAIAIIFMNVLVAILAFNFEKTNRQARILHYQHIIFFVRQGNYLQKHGCLIVIPIILEFSMLPYLILKRFFSHDSPQLTKVRQFYIYLSYSPILLLILSLVISLNIVLIPFAYIQRTFQLMRLLISRAIKPITLLKWILLGLFIIIKASFVTDLKELYKYLLAAQSQEEEQNIKSNKVKFDQTVQTIFSTACKLYVSGASYCTLSDLFGQLRDDMLAPNANNNNISQPFFETCVDINSIVGVHLIKRSSQFHNNSNNYSVQSSSPNLEKMKSFKRASVCTPNIQQIYLNKATSKPIQPKVDRINVKHVFEGIDGIDEETCELLYEYFEKFCFKDVTRDDDSRDSVLNLHNLLKLHEHYSMEDLHVAIHAQLYKIIRNN